MYEVTIYSLNSEEQIYKGIDEQAAQQAFHSAEVGDGVTATFTFNGVQEAYRV